MVMFAKMLTLLEFAKELVFEKGEVWKWKLVVDAMGKRIWFCFCEAGTIALTMKLVEIEYDIVWI